MRKIVKRRAVIFTTILSIIIFYSALMSFDRKISNLIYSSFQDKEGVVLYFQQRKDTEETIREKLAKTLEKYDLNAYYTYYDVQSQESILFAHSTDEQYLKPLYTKSKEQLKLNRFTEYSSISKDISTKLPSYGTQEVRLIKPLLSNNDDRYNIYDFHAITANDMSVFNGDLESLASTIEREFSDLGGIVVHVDSEDINIEPSVREFIILIVSTAILIGVLLINLILGKVKEISLLKLEGYATKDILYSYIIDPLIKTSILINLVFFLIYYFVINVPFDLGVFLIKYYLVYYFVSHLLLTIIFIISYRFIEKVPIYQYVKGKIHMTFLSRMIDLFKVVVAFLIILTSTEMIYLSKSFVSQLQRSKEYEQTLEKKYVLSRVKLGQNWVFSPKDSEYLLSRFDEYNGFYEAYQSFDKFHIATVDERFLNYYNIPLIKDVFYSSDKVSESLLEVIGKETGVKADRIERITKLPVYSLASGFEERRYYSNDPIIYIMNNESEILGTVFEYEGTLENAQMLVDDIFKDIGLESPFIVQSMIFNAELKFRSTKNDFLGMISQYVILVLLYYQITVSSLNIYQIVHEREDMLERTEGILILKSTRQHIFILGLTFIFVVVFSTILKVSSWKDNLLIFLLFVSIDVMIHLKPRKGIKL